MTLSVPAAELSLNSPYLAHYLCLLPSFLLPSHTPQPLSLLCARRRVWGTGATKQNGSSARCSACAHLGQGLTWKLPEAPSGISGLSESWLGSIVVFLPSSWCVDPAHHLYHRPMRLAFDSPWGASGKNTPREKEGEPKREKWLVEDFGRVPGPALGGTAIAGSLVPHGHSLAQRWRLLPLWLCP